MESVLPEEVVDLVNGMGKSCSVSSLTCNKPNSHAADVRPPERFSDPSTIVPPTSLQELISILHEIFAQDQVSVEYVKALMASYKSHRADWKRFAKFDPHRYTRNLVDEGNGKFNLMVLCWNEGQGSSIHSHANSHCFLKVLDGKLKEKMYEWPDSASCESGECEKTCGETTECKDEKSLANTSMKQREEYLFGKDECTYINDSIGLHRVENCSHIDKAVTLHLYSPPFQKCQCFDERTGRATTASMTFWSKYGRKTTFGHHPDKAIVDDSAENN